MNVTSKMDFTALAGSVIATTSAALFVAWLYPLDRDVVLRFGLFYFGMFAAVVGMPIYYAIKRGKTPNRSAG